MLRASIVLLTCLLAGMPAAQDPAPAATLWLPAIFGDHMVLQQDGEVVFWGRAKPGSDLSIEVPWLVEPYGMGVDVTGRWEARFRAPKADGRPFDVVVAAGGEQRTLRDVVLGEVWLCSGQSNMEWTLAPQRGNGGSDDHARFVAAADLPALRVFTVARRAAAAPMTDVEGAWVRSAPAVAGRLSAVGWHFGRTLQRELGVPVGIVVSAWGGTTAEAWTGPEGLGRMRDFDQALQALAAEQDGSAAAARGRQRAAFWAALEQQGRDAEGRGPERADFDDAAWPLVELPANWTKLGLGDFDGVVWYRRPVTVPPEWAGQDLLLELGPIDDMDTVFFAGVRIDGRDDLGHHAEPRSYRVPGSIVRGGTTMLAVRVVDAQGEGGFGGNAADLRLRPALGAAGAEVPLAGAWRQGQGPAMRELPSWPRAGVSQHTPSALHNGMIAPLVPFALRGFGWYQGESNRTRHEQYRELFPLLIWDWRQKWGAEKPFYFVQIAPFAYGGDTGEAALLRDAQQAALAVPHTGMVVTLDVGNPGDIHPGNKQAVGERLALQALVKTYGRQDLVCDGPVLARAARSGREVVLEFDHAVGGLQADGDGPRGFTVAAADAVFRPVAARIDGNRVRLLVDEDRPVVEVRYAFEAAPVADLRSGQGLPARPFRVRL